MAEAVRVVVRCRPMNRREKEDSRKSIVTIDTSLGTIAIGNPKGDEEPKQFTFDTVYDENSTQRNVYDEVGFPLVESVMSGYNGTMFAYGQTGCGKTHTMQGVPSDPDLRGVIPNSFEHIFENIKLASEKEFIVQASYIELYNEEIRDLLADDPKNRLELKESPDTGVYVKDLSRVTVDTVQAMEQLTERGNKHRTVGATLMNAESSRSHSIFTIVIEVGEKREDGSDHITRGKLNLVDLAGSERPSKTGATGARMKEGIKINLSLTALGNVISSLVAGKGKHIPYRDSKLTRLLQDSLGGNTKTVMMAAIGPADYNFDETLSTLRYANRAKNIKNKPILNEDPKDALLRQYKDEIETLRKLLQEHLPVEQYQAMMANYKLSANDTSGGNNLAKQKLTNGSRNVEHEPIANSAPQQTVAASQISSENSSSSANEMTTSQNLDKAPITSTTNPTTGAVDQSDTSEAVQDNDVTQAKSDQQTVPTMDVSDANESDHQQIKQETAEPTTDIEEDMDTYEDDYETMSVHGSTENVTDVSTPNQTLQKLAEGVAEGDDTSSAEMRLKLQRLMGLINKGGGDGEQDPEVELARQQHDQRRAELKLKTQKKREARLRAKQKKAEEEKNALEEEMKLLASEAEAQGKTAKKIKQRYEKRLHAIQRDLADAEDEWSSQKEALMNTMREQEKEIKLLEQVCGLFLSPSVMAKIWERAVWSEEEDTWTLPQAAIQAGQEYSRQNTTTSSQPSAWHMPKAASISHNTESESPSIRHSGGRHGDLPALGSVASSQSTNGAGQSVSHGPSPRGGQNPMRGNDMLPLVDSIPVNHSQRQSFSSVESNANLVPIHTNGYTKQVKDKKPSSQHGNGMLPSLQSISNASTVAAPGTRSSDGQLPNVAYPVPQRPRSRNDTNGPRRSRHASLEPPARRSHDRYNASSRCSPDITNGLPLLSQNGSTSNKQRVNGLKKSSQTNIMPSIQHNSMNNQVPGQKKTNNGGGTLLPTL